MIEKIMTSKIRAALLKFFLTHMDERYYLRELERLLGESLSPMRRQLLKLVRLGILVTEEEGNLKYYRLNKEFEGIDELRRLLLGAPAQEEVMPGRTTGQQKEDIDHFEYLPEVSAADERPAQPAMRRPGYELAVLSVVSLFVLLAAVYVIYASTASLKEVAVYLSRKTEHTVTATSKMIARPARPGEMASRRWKVISGSVPALSTGIVEDRRTKEL